MTWFDQDYRFSHPGTDSIAESRLRCNVFRTAFTFDPAFFAGLRSLDQEEMCQTSAFPLVNNP